MPRLSRWWSLLLLLVAFSASGQIDPVKRQLIQLGYNAPLQGHAPFAGYAFYYRNDPGFLQHSNLTLRLAVAPVYLDSELGIRKALGENTDLGFGLAGGGFADSYSEFHRGKFLPSESFTGHAAEGSISLYHLFNPTQEIPLNFVLRTLVHHSFYERDEKTAPTFVVPDNRTAFTIRTGFRWGGQEPMLFPALAMELSVWYEGTFRSDHGAYGFNGDRATELNSHLFWSQAMLTYTFPEWQHNFRLSLIAGASMDADRFSAFRLGAFLPLASEYPLNLPGYYYQEISAEKFFLMGASYMMPLDSKKRWNLNFQASGAYVEYLQGLSQPGHWHSGVGGGILYRSPNDGMKVLLAYSYGVNAIRGDDRGAHSISLLMQFDLEHTPAGLLNPANLYRWSGWLRLFGK